VGRTSVGEAGRTLVSTFLLSWLLQLEEVPAKFSLAPERGVWTFEIRQLNFGIGRRPTHRALFRIKDDEVVVLRIRHLAQDFLTADEL
jgi:plasmid stabilization system protein ParE